jgi:DNA-binding transcriptional ArsR family regulator
MVTDDVFAVIAEATRRDILVSLRSGDKAVGELVEELSASQPTISKHLKVLREADLVSMRAQGQKRYYALNTKPLAGIASWLEAFDVGGPASEQASAETAARTGQSNGMSAAEASTETASATAADVLRGVGTTAVAPGIRGGLDRSEDATGAAPRNAVLAVSSDDTMPQQIGRTVGRAATKAADILANLPKVPNLPRVANLPKVPNLPKFGRKK